MTGYRPFKISGGVPAKANVAKVANDRSAEDQSLATLATLAVAAAQTTKTGGQAAGGLGGQDLSALTIIKEAADCGVRVNLNGDCLVLKATTKPPASLLTTLKEHKADIVALLRKDHDEDASAATSRPSWWPQPHPRIVREPRFGSDRAPPERYRAAWDGLLAQCPSGMAPLVWETAMYDTARLFGDFGIELERRAWRPGDLFDKPHGLVWFIKGNYAAAIGATMAQLGNGRIWRATR